MYQTPQLPHQPPFVVHAEVNPQFQQYLPLATGMAMQLAMQNANISPFRHAFVDYISQNNWQNPGFEQLAKMVAQYAETISAQRRQDPGTAIRYAADKLLHVLTAAFVNSNPSMFPQIHQDPNVGAAIQTHLRDLQEITQLVTAFYTQRQQMGYQQPQMMGGYPQQQQFNQHPFQRQPPQPQAYPMHMGYQVQQPPQYAAIQPVQKTNSFNQIVGGNVPGVEFKRSTEAEYRATGVEQSLRIGASPQPTPPVKEVTPPQPVIVPVIESENWVSLTDSQWPKVLDRSRPWDAVKLENGVEIRPYGKTDWVRDVSKQPYSLTFNPMHHLKFLLKDSSGNVNETLLTWEPSMEYLEHELDLSAARLYLASKNRNENVVFEPIQIVEIDPVKNKKGDDTDALTEVLFAKAVNHRIIHGALLTNGFKEARRLLEIKLDGMDKFNPDEPYEYTVDIVKDLLIYASDQEHVESIVNANSHKEIIEPFSRINDDIAKSYLNERLCERVNFELNNRFAISWKISDIVEDYPELIKELNTTYGQNITTVLNQRFDRIVNHALPVIDTNAMTDEDLEQLCRLKGYSPDDISKEHMAVSFFTLRSSITVLPYTFEDLGLVLSDQEPRLVRPKEYAQLHDDLKAILDRNAGLPYPIQHRYVQFKDRTIVEVYYGLLIDDSILLRLTTLEE